MSVTYDIARQTDFNNEDRLNSAMAQMANVNEADLHHVILINGSAQSNEWRKAGALARGELERRNAEAAKTLAMKTTCISAAMGILGVVVGAFLGFWLSPSGSSIGGANATEHEVESQSR